MEQRTPFVLEVAMEMALPKPVLDAISVRFGPDKAIECAMANSVGGIGPLLRERIFDQAELGANVIGVSLLYGSVWIQAWHEWGQINLQKRKMADELRQFLTPTNFGFKFTFFDGTSTHVDVWELAYGQTKVYFLDAPSVTDVVYPGPKDAARTTANPFTWSHEHRLRQSWLIGRGSLALMKKMDRCPDIITLSETPTFFANHRLVRDDLQQDPFFKDVKYVFNDHTPLEYAHPIWDLHTMEMVKIDPAVYENKPCWNPQKKTLDVTSLLVGACEGVFGVAKKHGEVMRKMPSLHKFADKITHITNGVRRADWQVPEFAEPDKLSDEELIAVKQRYKAALVDWAWRRFRLWPNWAEEAKKRNILIWTRRITPYKRLDILLKMLRVSEMRKRFLDLNLLVFIGGRIHQQDNHAQDIVYDLLDIFAHDKDLESRIVFLDNFNVWEAPHMYRGADATVMMADDTREASATGFMKAQMNGAAVLATADGAIPEFVKFAGDRPSGNGSEAVEFNGFLIPYVHGEPTTTGLLEAFEAFDFTFRNARTVAAVMRNAIAVTADVSLHRTSNEMFRLYDSVMQTPPGVPS